MIYNTSVIDYNFMTVQLGRIVSPKLFFMALQGSGQISFSQIENEFGQNGERSLRRLSYITECW